MWTLGDQVEIFSHSDSYWYVGTIIDIKYNYRLSNKYEGDEGRLVVRYTKSAGNTCVRDVSRENVDLRRMS